MDVLFRLSKPINARLPKTQKARDAKATAPFNHNGERLKNSRKAVKADRFRGMETSTEAVLRERPKASSRHAIMYPLIGLNALSSDSHSEHVLKWCSKSRLSRSST